VKPPTLIASTSPDAWLAQAEHDLDTAAELRRIDRWAWSCYAASQAAEKAIKSMLVAWGANLNEGQIGRAWRSHDLEEVFNAFHRPPPNSADLTTALTTLPQHDQKARYPDQTRGAPCTSYGDDDARYVIELATVVVAYAREVLPALKSATQQVEAAAAAAVARLPPVGLPGVPASPTSGKPTP